MENNKEKMSYEQLENVAHQMSEQSRQLYAKVQELTMTNTFKRLDYLFKILDHAEAFGAEFVTGCIQEIELLMTIPEDKEVTDKED